MINSVKNLGEIT